MTAASRQAYGHTGTGAFDATTACVTMRRPDPTMRRGTGKATVYRVRYVRPDQRRSAVRADCAVMRTSSAICPLRPSRRHCRLAGHRMRFRGRIRAAERRAGRDRGRRRSPRRSPPGAGPAFTYDPARVPVGARATVKAEATDASTRTTLTVERPEPELDVRRARPREAVRPDRRRGGTALPAQPGPGDAERRPGLREPDERDLAGPHAPTPRAPGRRPAPSGGTSRPTAAPSRWSSTRCRP